MSKTSVRLLWALKSRDTLNGRDELDDHYASLHAAFYPGQMPTATAQSRAWEYSCMAENVEKQLPGLLECESAETAEQKFGAEVDVAPHNC